MKYGVLGMGYEGASGVSGAVYRVKGMKYGVLGMGYERMSGVSGWI